MNKRSVIASLMIFASNVVLGCTCYLSESFDLSYYDDSKNVVEIKITEKLKDDYEERLIKYQKDTLGWNKKYPPLPLRPSNNFMEFSIKIVEVYKGNANKTTTILRATDKNSSCYWEPEVGESYIFYYGDIIEQKGNEIIEIGGCQRRIRSDNKNYDIEVKALEILRKKGNGKFVIDQSNLTSPYYGAYFPVKGKFRNGERHGKWIIGEPIMHLGKSVGSKKKVLILKYKNGDLISTQYFKPDDRRLEDRFTRRWKSFYEEKTVINVRWPPSVCEASADRLA